MTTKPTINGALRAASTLALASGKNELAAEFAVAARDYILERDAFNELKRLCVDVESFAAHHACNARSVNPLAEKVYRSCCDMRRIIYPANPR